MKKTLFLHFKPNQELKLYKASLQLTPIQREIILGTLLGDAHLRTHNNKTYNLQFYQSNLHKSYIDHLYSIFHEWVLTPPKQRLSTGCWFFNTFTHPDIVPHTHYGIMFYNQRVKIIPTLIHDLLTPRALAYWYMDDGSMKSKQSKGVLLNTHCFELKDINLLCTVLESKFNLNCWPRQQKHKNKIYYQIYISGKSYDILSNLIKPYLLPCMLYKFPESRKL